MWVTNHLEMIVLYVVVPSQRLPNHLIYLLLIIFCGCHAWHWVRHAFKFGNVSGGTNLHFCGYHQHNHQNLRKYSPIHIESMSCMHMDAILTSFRDTCESYIMFLSGNKAFYTIFYKVTFSDFLSSEGDVSSHDFLCNHGS